MWDPVGDLEIERRSREKTSEAVRHALERWTSAFEITPRKINSGDCEVFAGVVKKVSSRPEDLRLIGCEIGGYEVLHPLWGGHVWVHDLQTGRHYDAECPEGTDNWRCVPITIGV